MKLFMRRLYKVLISDDNRSYKSMNDLSIWIFESEMAVGNWPVKG